uniref:Kinesin-like protein n=1 Tax=Romanomermis culicivorax TaxID=13658 RepID=A0A915IPC8_ROMCU
QETVFKHLGTDVLENAFQGYNACILAYGQTGSGKSYTMMGSLNQTGLIPRLCSTLFERIYNLQNQNLNFKVEVSFMEIYNEKVRDLLDPKGCRHNLKVREHSILGPYVDGLSILAVSSHDQIESLIKEGNKSRTVAATNMNAESSRSHAVFCIKLTQILNDLDAGVSGEKVSRISLVDLAGSERAQKSGAVGERLREGSNINKSLTTLGLVISALADHSKAKQKFVPYRDSVLTWLLKDSLGGNSKTVMVATVSPAADNYDETMSTLRYADRAKKIVNHAVVNEDPNAKIIRELKAEVEMLKIMLKKQNEAVDLKDRLAESEKLMGEIGKSWEDRLKETELVHKEWQQNLAKMGISVQSSGIKVEHGKFYLVNLNADPSLNELLVYYLKTHTTVGYPNTDIQLQGLGIAAKHAVFTIDENYLYIEPLEGSRVCVNGSSIGVKTLLKHGDRILFGNNHFFRVNCPAIQSITSSTSSMNLSLIDYDFAQEELMMKEMFNDPVAAAVNALEKQHQLDKEAALEKQRRMYEQQIQSLKNQCLSPGTPSAGGIEFSLMTPLSFALSSKTPSTPNLPLFNVQSRYVQWAKSRDEMFKKSLAKLKEEIIKANSLIREANLMAADMGRQTNFSVTLQIPASNLSPSKI